MPTPIKYFFQIREGKSLDPETLIADLKQKYGGVGLHDLSISELEFDNEVVSEKVYAIQLAIRSGTEMPPIIAEKNSKGIYHVLDGNHRVVARQREGYSFVTAWVPMAPSLQDK